MSSGVKASAVRATWQPGFAFVRTPLLPFSTFDAWAGPSLPEAQRGLLRLLESPVVLEALELGAPDLFLQLDAYQSDPRSERGQRIERALVRYVSRMSSRPTPFACFAAVGLGAVDARNRLAATGLDALRRHARVSTRFLVNVVAVLERDPQVRHAVRWSPNPTLTPGPMAEFVVSTNTREKVFHDVRQVELTEPVQALVNAARGGASFGDLVHALRGAVDDVSDEEARGFVDEVATAQVLVSELRVPATTPRPDLALLDCLRARGLSAQAEALERVVRSVGALSGGRPGTLVRADRDAALDAARALVTPDLVHSTHDVLSLDLERPATGLALGRSVVREVERACAWLQTLGAPVRGLGPMVQAFATRYEEREVPLLEALDPRRGIPLPVEALPPGLAALPLGGTQARLADEVTPPAWLVDQWTSALRSGAREVVLDPPATDEAGRLPDFFSIWFRLEARDAEAVERGEFRVRLIGPSDATSGFARFGGVVAGLTEQVDALVRHAEALAPDVVFAELVHLPSGYSDNVVTRPAWRRYEIPIAGRSSLPPEQQLPLDDLLLSVRDGAFVVRSRRLGKRVIPTAATAYNYEMSRESRPFRVLSALAEEPVRVTLPLGHLDGGHWRPRLRLGRVVFSPEQWTVPSERRAELKRLPEREHAAWVARERARLGWPRYVLAGPPADDQLLCVDLDNPLLVDSFVHLVATQVEPLVVREAFIGDGSGLWSPEGPLVNEFIVPFVRDAAPAPVAPGPPARPPPTGPRLFAPGSPWAYLKVYGAPTMTERWLLEDAAPLLARARASGELDGWFFLHYADPDRHLRLRLHGTPEHVTAWAHRLLDGARGRLDAGLSRIEWSTYVREVERYGGDHGIDLAETAFCADSEFALGTLPRLQHPDERWLTLLAATDRLFTDFGVDLAARAALITHLRDAYAAEHGAGPRLEAGLSELGRARRAMVDELLDGRGELAERLRPPLDARSARLVPLAQAFRALVAEGKLDRPLAEVVASLAHMQSVRLLDGAVRPVELVVYDLLERGYRSRAARAKPR